MSHPLFAILKHTRQAVEQALTSIHLPDGKVIEGLDIDSAHRIARRIVRQERWATYQKATAVPHKAAKPATPPAGRPGGAGGTRAPGPAPAVPAAPARRVGAAAPPAPAARPPVPAAPAAPAAANLGAKGVKKSGEEQS